jgi:hypothetical protein
MEMLRMKKLPIGIQTFREIIEEDYAYADKTREVYNLINGGKYYFLSRPRRFGKSLLLDTIAEAFSGDRTLFEGLWIAGAESDWGFERYPVLRVDMSQIPTTSFETVAAGLSRLMLAVAEAEGLTAPAGETAEMFRQIIEALMAKHGKRVVVLIDEYDKPIIDHLDNADMAEQMRSILGSFYGIIKGQDANIRFAMLTGVSKFTKLSLFSKLNNLFDITLREPYSAICGFTHDELKAVFSEHLAACRETMRLKGDPGSDKNLDEFCRDVLGWYDGFSWDGKVRLLNPFSLLSFLSAAEYDSFWYSTGIPSFLMQDFKARPGEYLAIQEANITERLLDSHDIEHAPLVSLLFQTGFLTVRAKDRAQIPPEYNLSFPNAEVSQAFAEMFINSFPTELDPYSNSFIKKVREALDTGMPEAVAEPLAGLYASIPYQLHMASEAYYHTMFLVAMQFLGFRVIGELSCANGRADGVLDRPNGKSYVIEFKYVDDETGLQTALDAALVQIEKKGYAERYRGSSREVFRLAIAVAGRGKVAACAKV